MRRDRTICAWTDKLPEECREDPDEIPLTAARNRMGLRDLAGLAGEIYVRSRPGKPDEDEDTAFEDRSVKLETTFDSAGVLARDLTPECAAVVRAVLDALSAPAGAEDTRSQAQRFHDGLHEAMKRLVAAGRLPERAGQLTEVATPTTSASWLIVTMTSVGPAASVTGPRERLPGVGVPRVRNSQRGWTGGRGQQR